MKKKENNHKSDISLSILIPVKNEGINIIIMLKILKSVLEFPHEILIIYDSDKDSAIASVKHIRKTYPQVKSVKNKFGKGVKNAIKSGVIVAKGKFILIFAVDEIGPVIAIEDMLNLMNKGCDFVSCTRYAYGGRRLGGSLLQGFISRTANYFFRLIIGSTLTDSTTGIKMFKRDIFNKLTLTSNVGWAFVFEMSIKVQEQGYKLGEVPIVSIDRLYGGKSSFSLVSWIKEYSRWFVYGISHYKKLHANKNIMVRIPKSTLV
jgi:dolichol-phosphate mannosyltransferase